MATLKEWLAAAQQGDATAVETLVSTFTPVIESECARFGLRQHPDLSETDLYQEVVLRVWTRLDQFSGCENDIPDPEIVFKQWIRATARSALSNLMRARKVKKRFPVNGVQSLEEGSSGWELNERYARTASSIMRGNEDAQRLIDAIENCLDSESRRILKLRVLEGMSIKKISNRLALTPDQVRYNYYKSLAILEKRLAQ